MEVSIVIPAYNEENNIERLLLDTHKVFKDNDYIGEIIVVNDCSTDETLEVCKRLKTRIKNLVIVTHKERGGKTKAVLSGVKNAKTRHMVMIDADYQYDPFDIPKIVYGLEMGYKMVCGWRAKRKDPFLRLLLSYFFNLIDRVLFGIKIHDINCGLKGYDINILKQVDFKFQNFFIDTELLAHIYRAKLPIMEVKINHFPRERDMSKINVIKTTLDIFIDCFRLKFYLKNSKKLGD